MQSTSTHPAIHENSRNLARPLFSWVNLAANCLLRIPHRHMHIYIYINTYQYVRIHLYMYIYIYMCTHVYKLTNSLFFSRHVPQQWFTKILQNLYIHCTWNKSSNRLTFEVLNKNKPSIYLYFFRNVLPQWSSATACRTAPLKRNRHDFHIWLIGTWLTSLMCDMAHGNVNWLMDMRHDLLMCDMTGWCVIWLTGTWHGALMYDMTRWYVTCLMDMWHESLIRDVQIWSSFTASRTAHVDMFHKIIGVFCKRALRRDYVLQKRPINFYGIPYCLGWYVQYVYIYIEICIYIYLHMYMCDMAHWYVPHAHMCIYT